jgi:hypothetical protein
VPARDQVTNAVEEMKRFREEHEETLVYGETESLDKITAKMQRDHSFIPLFRTSRSQYL